jgi:hypothetical protein
MKRTFVDLIIGIGILILFPQWSSAQWVQVSISANVSALVVSGSDIFAGGLNGTNGGLFLSTNNGSSWTEADSGLNSGVSALAVMGNNIIAGLMGDCGHIPSGGGICRSTNKGTSWTYISGYLPVSCLTVNGTYVFAGILGAYCGGVGLSADSGKTWGDTNYGLPHNPHGGRVPILSIAARDSNVFAGTDGSFTYSLTDPNIYLSINNGANWTAINSGLPNTPVMSLLTNGNNLFAGTTVGVFISTDNGTSWTPANTGLPDSISVYSFTFSGSTILAGTSKGVFLSGNNGTSWADFNTGLSATNVGFLAYNSSNLFAGTQGGGVWRRPQSDIPAVSTKQYVNPTEKFNISLNNMLLKYTLPATSDVSVRIFDLKGRSVFSSITRRQSTGLHTLPLTTVHGLSSGSYILEFSAGVYKVCKTIIMKL